MNEVNEPESSGKESSTSVTQDRVQQQRLKILEKWYECTKILNSTQGDKSDEDPQYCPPVWDQVFCWPRSKAGQLISFPCPKYIVDFNLNATATKLCTENGTWFFDPDKKSYYTNYTECMFSQSHPIPETANPQDELLAKWLPVIKRIAQVGYAFSFVTLLIAFAILISIKKLRCPRNTLHLHMFVSFILRAFMALLKDSLFVEGVDLKLQIVDGTLQPASWECKLVTSLWQYFILANYTWILMEGLYLHNLIFLSPFSDSSAITLYVILGWGIPVVVVGSWITSRIIWDDTLCWTTNHNYTELFYIIRIPIIITIVLNFIFFVNIVRVLLLKLQSAVSIESRKYRYRKWAKSTLVLVPLFGVNYMSLIGLSYFVGKNVIIELIWLFWDQLFASFQGVCVGLLYCFFMHEVRVEVSRKWNSWRTESRGKNIWIPLNHITSKFYSKRPANDDLTNGLSAATSMAVHHSTVTEPLTGFLENRPRRRPNEIEVTEEHDIDM